MKLIATLSFVLLVVGLGGCTSDAANVGDVPSGAPTAAAAPSTTESVEPADPSAEPLPDDSSPASKTPDPDLTQAPVPEEEASAPAASFGKKVTYKDGTEVEVTSVQQRSMAPGATVGTGKGKAGQSFYLMTIEIKNNTTKTLVAAGADTLSLPNGNVAKSVVDSSTSALGGKIAPGTTRTGKYGYVVPQGQTSKVTLEFYWDNDSDHDAATFTGDLKTF